ncbi:MAG: TolC family protein [Candidatus Omnitrophica bacterium]|nr:TolC family protein [Candidatus Omnitrophota bacterium]
MRQFSKNTLKLLKLFYSHPEQQFYIQELGRLLKTKPGVFQRTLYNLQKDGVLQSYYKAGARFFSVNKSYPFYKEFRSIVQKSSKFAVIAVICGLLSLCGNNGFCEENKTDALLLSSLSDAIQVAYKNNKDIQIQEYSLKVASADILNAKSEFLPKVDFNAGYTRNGAVLTSTANTKKDIGVFSGYKNNNNMGIAVSDTIYNGGANIAALRQSRLVLKEQNETLRAIKLNVELEARRLYYGLLLAYETKRIAENLVNQAESHYEEVNNKFKQGTSSRFDALQSKVQVSLLLPQLINAENSIKLIMAEMNKLLGLKVSDKVIIKDKLIYDPFEIKEEDFLREAYLNQPEMILKSLGIDISKWAIKYARAGWLPQVEANGQYFYQSNNLGNMFNSRHNNWNIGFAVRLALFDGFSTKAKVDSARAKYMQAVLGKDNYSDQVAVDIRQACLDLEQAVSIIQSQEDNLEDAKEALDISYVRYNNGVGINLDVLDAQVSLANVEKNLAEGIYDYLMAKAKLDRTMGRSLDYNRSS